MYFLNTPSKLPRSLYILQTVMLRMGFGAIQLDAFSSSGVLNFTDIVYSLFLLPRSSLCSPFLNQFYTAAKRVSAPVFLPLILVTLITNVRFLKDCFLKSLTNFLLTH